MMYVTRDNLTHIKGYIMEVLFSGHCSKLFPSYGDVRVFIYVKLRFFLAVVDYLIECKIAPPNILLEMKPVGGEEEILLQ